jgi:molybdopterin-guanine dinucleotide biosynthesis protein A
MPKSFPTPVSIAILAGGESSRMGQDKGLLHLLGIPLIERVLLQVDGLSDKVMLVTNQPDEYRRFGVRMRTDARPGTGPLGGVYSALHYATHDCILVLSCDMPFVSRPLLEYMLSVAPGWDAVVPRLGDSERIEPLRAVYSKNCIEAILTALDAGRRRVVSFFESVNVRYVEIDDIERFDPGAGTFFNINTPADLTAARDLAVGYPLPQLPSTT